MKKLLAFTLALTVMFGCACSSAAKPSGDRPGPVSDADEADDTDVVVEDIHFDYPDQIVTKPGGTAGMTVYKCGILYYACVDGNCDNDTENQLIAGFLRVVNLFVGTLIVIIFELVSRIITIVENVVFKDPDAVCDLFEITPSESLAVDQ